jgi:hypothetical protein
MAGLCLEGHNPAMGIGQWTNKLQRFWHLRLTDKWLFLCAVYWLGVARIWLIKVPFPELAERLSADPGTKKADPEVLRRGGFAVSSAGGNDYASTIHLGVDKAGDDELLAHAWLTCGEKIVTGESEAHRYAEIHRLGE